MESSPVWPRQPDEVYLLRWKKRGNTVRLLLVVDTVKLSTRKLGSFVSYLVQNSIFFLSRCELVPLTTKVFDICMSQ